MSSTSPFIRRLPVEIRDKIYRILLVNPTIGTFAAVEHGDRRHKKIKSTKRPQIFRQICQVIYDSCPRQVNIIVFKVPISAGPVGDCAALMDLRNFGLLTFENRILHGVSLGSILITEFLESGILKLVAAGVGSACQEMLKKLAEGNSPVERLFEMYHYLARFALSFEIYVAFKLSMAPGGSESDSTFAYGSQLWAQSGCKQQTWKESWRTFTKYNNVLYDFSDQTLDKARKYAYNFHRQLFKTY
ncbi:hypothetical protein CJF31_00008129 [Rutstroemia sp. NJR-2017a BVV2]|nr:hypothetical protein CJF31_00008129 [Rutstroemia sp. NJR-2017a BVV2]